MLFPASTSVDKRIPKQKFYEHLTLSPQLKRCFVDGIRLIYWRNKISEDTVHIPKGEQVTEIEVFEIKLSGQDVDEAVLQQIDKEIPYHIVFLLEHEGKYQAWTVYKESAAGAGAFRVRTYYHTDWVAIEELPLRIEGLDLDRVYENLVRQIAGDVLAANAGETLQETVAKDARRQELQRRIVLLEAKVKKEKQFNKQVQMSTELRALRRELESL